MAPFHPELPEELSTRVLPLAPAGRSELVWKMEMPLEGKEMGQAGEWDDPEKSQDSSQACVFRGERGKKGSNKKRKSRGMAGDPGEKSRRFFLYLFYSQKG